ncbi:MAG: MFS transporter [Nocardioides sp.]|nr:MFS transporter [Nocardioides sp.]
MTGPPGPGLHSGGMVSSASRSPVDSSPVVSSPVDRASAGTAWRVGLVGALTVGVAYGMGRYAYGLTLPSVRNELDLPSWVAGTVAGGTFAGFLLALLVLGPLTHRRGPRAPVLLGTLLGALGAATVALSPAVGPLAAGAVATGASAGLVWAPFSDLVERLAPEGLRPTLLSVVTTGTSGGLVLLGGSAAVLPTAQWRGVWIATSLLSVLALVLVRWWVPALAPGDASAPETRWTDLRAVRAPVLYALPYLGGVVVWFSYASAAVRDRDLPASLGAALYVVVGVCGLAGLLTGRLVGRWGPVRVGAAALLSLALALGLLAAPLGGPVPVVASAVVAGPGYMAGSALLAVWAARQVPRRSGRAFVMTLVSGSVASVLAPPAVAAVVPRVGLPTALSGVAGLLAVSALVMLLLPRQGTASADPSGASDLEELPSVGESGVGAGQPRHHP